MTSIQADASFWNRAAAKYAARPVQNPSSFERKKAITQRLLPSDAKVLEIGCGTGSLALEMARHAGHIHAVDISEAMIRIADEKKAAQGIENVTFYAGTLSASSATPSGERAQKMGPDEVDAVWAYSILHLMEDRRSALTHLYGRLRPGGVFVSSNVCLGGSWVPYGALITVLRWLGKAPRVFLYDRATIRRDLEEAGFVDIEEHDVGSGELVAFITAKKPER